MGLTKDDKQFIVETVRSTVKTVFVEDRKHLKIYLDDLFNTKLDEKFGEKYKERFGNLPTKDEFYEQNLKILKRLDDVEEQGKMLNSRTYDNTDRIDELEKLHPNSTHPVFA